MKSFGRSERIFIGIGFSLVLLSLVLLLSHYSFVNWFHPPIERADGFRAAYSEAERVPEVKAVEPMVQAVSEYGEDFPDPGVFLLEPLSAALLTQKPGIHSNSVQFRFEVYPRFTASRFVVFQQGKVIVSNEVSGNGSGKYLLQIALPGAGSYQWQVKALESTSELRTFTLRR